MISCRFVPISSQKGVLSSETLRSWTNRELNFVEFQLYMNCLKSMKLQGKTMGYCENYLPLVIMSYKWFDLASG